MAVGAQHGACQLRHAANEHPSMGSCSPSQRSAELVIDPGRLADWTVSPACETAPRTMEAESDLERSIQRELADTLAREREHGVGDGRGDGRQTRLSNASRRAITLDD